MKRVLFWYWWWGSFIFYVLTYMAPKILFLKLTEKTKGIEKAEEEAFRVVHKWAERCVRQGKSTVTISGTENIPEGKPLLYVSNHQSYADIPMIIYALGSRKVAFMLKDTMLKIPFIGNYLRYMHCIPVNQKSAREAAHSVSLAVDEINKGMSIVIFPEGKRSFNNLPAEFKNGAFRIVMKTGVTLQPIYLHNVHRVYEGNGCMVTPADVHINILEPIETSEMTRADIKTLNEKVFNVINDFAIKFNKDYEEKING